MKIGLTFTGIENVHDNYVRWLKKDNTVEVVKLEAGKNTTDEMRDLDALVLSGGIDVDPELYKGKKEYAHAPEGWERDRDDFELLLLQQALQHGKPVLGVCRGLQLMNVFFDGTLVQDIGESNNVKHKGGPDKKHTVFIEKESLLNHIAGAPAGTVSSAHHQVIDQLGEGLKVNARSEEGFIEGIEWKESAGKPFMLAVQWHPERMDLSDRRQSPLSENIRDRFLEEINKSKLFTK